ncbi:hypothetical protein [uncultured Psychrobacter sp.]|mgnify:CR=1 FL=1|uniref:hypothetical protein n=1 Tax=uncultured Psychrobacter sp. TaxID=259303 RepID=UPI00260EE65B|nr:hypothetical protein [uncultured Psychrobacter sp.]
MTAIMVQHTKADMSLWTGRVEPFETQRARYWYQLAQPYSFNKADEINKGNFIKNLYERLSTIKIEIPEINNRREDIVPICEYYLGYYNQNKKYKFSFHKMLRQN